MHSHDRNVIPIRPLIPEDRSSIVAIVSQVGNFNKSEIDCALELVDTYLADKVQDDYRVIVAENSERSVCGYACWGPTPMTRATYDLYWIATHPGCQGNGVGRALMSHIEERVQEQGGRLLVVETSSKESYGITVKFYRSLGYEENSRIRDFYDVGDDRLVFIKRFFR